jgi:hypothetical protein
MSEIENVEDAVESSSSKKNKYVTKEEVKEMVQTLVAESMKLAVEQLNSRATKIYRNWANQHDPKSDLVHVSSLSAMQLRNFIDYLITNEYHFHYFADHGGAHNTIQCSGAAYRLWNAELVK